MERLTGKGAKSLKEAYAKVYSEQATPDYASMSDEEFAALVKKSGNPEGLMAKRKQQQIAARENTRANYTAADAKADQERAKVEAENKRRAEAEEGQDPLPVPRGSQLKDPRPAVAPTSTPKPPTDQQRVRTEYDRLRNSKDPDERAQAVTYGRQMAAAGAAKKDFSGYQSAADAKKNLPAPAQRTSIADRLKAIRDMRARSQSRITAQGGKPATPAVQPKTQPAAAQPAAQPKVQPTAQPKVQPTTNPNQQSSLNNTVRSGSSGIRNPMKDPITVDDKVSGTSSTYQSGQRMSGADSSLVRSMQSQIRSNKVPTGNTVKTAVNPDSSLRVTQKRTPAATARIKKSLELSSVDLFDIIQGEFIEEGYTQEDTVYMMANLNEEQLQEFMKYVQGAINVGKRIPGIRGAINRVGAMFNRAPKQMPAGQVGALRLYQDKANQSMQRLNQSTAASRIKDATTKPTTRNLDPRAVSDRNAREAASQVRARNTQLGRPVDAAPQPVDKLNYKPGDPMFDDYVKRHHANQRGGVVKFTDGARRIDK